MTSDQHPTCKQLKILLIRTHKHYFKAGAAARQVGQMTDGRVRTAGQAWQAGRRLRQLDILGIPDQVRTLYDWR